MNIPKQLINLVGVVLFVAIVVAGLALVAVPMWAGAQTTEASARSVEQTNDIYALEVDTLTAADSRMPEITDALAELRTEIPRSSQLDDAFEIIATASAATGAVVESVTAGEIEAWSPRELIGDAESSDDEAAATDAVDESSAADEASSEAAPADAEVDTAPAGALPPQQEVPITIEVKVVDAATAAAFVDALRLGPRLLAPVDATLDDGTLIVTALAFIRTED